MLNDVHAELLAKALKKILGKEQEGSIAFVRCLDPSVIRDLCRLISTSSAFDDLKDWNLFGVVDEANADNLLITADMAVEIREEKGEAAVLLVDVNAAGAGMDGIYNAGREITEKELFEAANKEAHKTIPHGWSSFAKKAVAKARRLGGHTTISPWREFDFYSSCTSSDEISIALVKLGLWPVAFDKKPDIQDLDTSVLLVERLFFQGRTSVTAESRVDSLMLQEPTEQQKHDLVSVGRQSASLTLMESVARLIEKPHLWVNHIRPFPSGSLIKIEIHPWRGRTGRVSAWTGLSYNDAEERLQFILDPLATGKSQSKLEVRWNAFPDTLAKGAAEYSVVIISGDEELAVKSVSHSGRSPQKCVFNIDDFELDEGAKFEAHVRIQTVGNEDLNEVTEDFLLMFGEKPDIVKSSAGKLYRSIIEGAILIDQKKDFDSACKNDKYFDRDAKGYVTFRFQADGSKTCNAKMYCPALLRMIEEDWGSRNGTIGRWFVSIRADGTPVSQPQFIPCSISVGDAVCDVSRKMAAFAAKRQGITGMVHGCYDIEKDYINTWQKEFTSNKPALALQNTLEVRMLSGDTVGLIVLPFHPLRLAWHCGYDQLLSWCKFGQGMSHKKILDIASALDGAHFPAFLPGLKAGESFMFGDTLGFHAVAMVADSDNEPKASVAFMAKVLSGGKDEIAPSIGKTTSDIMATEISRYLMLHPEYNLVSIHAIRPGDGMTIGRALGESLKKHQMHQNITDDELEEKLAQDISFSLELFPSERHQQFCGRFFATITEKKRSGAGSVSEDDRWMLEPCRRDGEVTIPKLYWAKRSEKPPISAAHLSVAFDTFDSQVITAPLDNLEPTATEVFGLYVNLVRTFTCDTQPIWQTYLSPEIKGKRHPSEEVLTDRLSKLHKALMMLTSAHLGASGQWPVLRTRIDVDKERAIESLHRLSDWVITIDRNAGIEYFDSPHENTSVYDAYIIDCVPERENLGFMQMVTSTSNFDEVRKLLDLTLTEIGLSASPRNCLFLLNELKALSGRFAMRLSGSGNRPQEMVALSMMHTVSSNVSTDDEQWLSLNDGFFVPIDDVPDLLGIDNETTDDDKRRADLLYVTVPRRGGFQFSFVEVKFRRYLKTARANDVLEAINKQLKSSRNKWEQMYGAEVSSLEKALRRSWLARILKFYAAKGRRHNLDEEAWQRITKEIDKMVREGDDYQFPESAEQETLDRGYIFCPEYTADTATIVSYQGQSVIYLFGAKEMPDHKGNHISMSDVADDNNLQIQQSRTNIEQLANGYENIESGAQNKINIDHSHLTYGNKTSLIDESLSECDETPAPLLRNTDTCVLLGQEPNTNDEVCWKVSIQSNPHLMIVGLPGMGKTTSLISICNQMVSQAVAPIVFSYHNDIDEKLAGIFGDDIQFVDYAGLGFNPLHVVSDSPMAYVDNISMIRDIFASIFPDLGDIQLGRLREALKNSYLDKGWGNVENAKSSLELPEFQSFYDYLKATTKNDKADKGLLTRLNELNDYGFFNAYSGSRSLLDSNKISIIRIHKTQNEVLQKAFSTFVLHNLYQQMFIRGMQGRISHAVIFDEAHRAASLKLIPTMAKECRKYGIAFVLASQEAKDFDPSLFNAVANYLALRLNETDAKVLAKIMANTDHVNRFTDRIKQMQKYHAFFFGEGRNKAVFTKLAG